MEFFSESDVFEVFGSYFSSVRDSNRDRHLLTYKVRSVMAPYDTFDIVEDCLIPKTNTYYIPANSGKMLDINGVEVFKE